MNWWERFKVDVPVGCCGAWRVERFVVDEAGSRWADLQDSLHGCGGRYVPPGTYTRLVRGGGVWEETVMSDTPAEVGDFLEVVDRASGVCLVNGLGLGVVVNALLLKEEVERVDVVEISEEVISLVGAHWLGRFGGRLRIVCGDAFVWRPARGVVYDVVWHDVWDGICGDNLEGMKRLHRAYGRRARWQGSWARELCRR